LEEEEAVVEDPSAEGPSVAALLAEGAVVSAAEEDPLEEDPSAGE